MTDRADLLARLAERISAIGGRIIVAVDGVDGAGKTMFAEELAGTLMQRGRSVVHTSIDRFHNKREVRYRQGKSDPKGFFEDSYDYLRFQRDLVLPFRRGDTEVLTAGFDHVADIDLHVTSIVDDSTILLIDGIFLHRDELADLWDFSVFLSVPFSVSYARMASRDGSNPEPRAAENRRYYEGQQIYLRSCRPETRATIVIDNSVIDAPVVQSDLGA